METCRRSQGERRTERPQRWENLEEWGSEVLMSGQRWVDHQKTARELSDRDKEALLTQPPVTRLPGREIEKWSCQEHGTGCRGGQSLIVPGPFPHSAWACAPARGRLGGRFGDTRFLARWLTLSWGQGGRQHPQRDSQQVRESSQPHWTWFPGPGNLQARAPTEAVRLLEARPLFAYVGGPHLGP